MKKSGWIDAKYTFSLGVFTALLTIGCSQYSSNLPLPTRSAASKAQSADAKKSIPTEESAEVTELTPPQVQTDPTVEPEPEPRPTIIPENVATPIEIVENIPLVEEESDPIAAITEPQTEMSPQENQEPMVDPAPEVVNPEPLPEDSNPQPVPVPVPLNGDFAFITPPAMPLQGETLTLALTSQNFTQYLYGWTEAQDCQAVEYGPSYPLATASVLSLQELPLRFTLCFHGLTAQGTQSVNPSAFQMQKAEPVPVQAQLKRVYQGQITLPADSNSVEVSLPEAIEMGKSLLVFDFRLNADNPGKAGIQGLVQSATTLKFHRDTSNQAREAHIRWKIIEFASGVKVQRGVSTTREVTIEPVDPKKSFPLLGGNINSGNHINGDDSPYAQLIASNSSTSSSSSSNSGSSVGSNNTSSSISSSNSGNTVNTLKIDYLNFPDKALNSSWQVIEWEGISVQSGMTTLSNNLTTTAQLANPVDRNKTFLLPYTTSDSTVGDVFASMLVNSYLASDNQIEFSRAQAMAETRIYWYAIELGQGAVQHLKVNLPINISDETVSLDIQAPVGESFTLTAGTWNTFAAGIGQGDNTHSVAFTTNILEGGDSLRLHRRTAAIPVDTSVQVIRLTTP